MPKSENLQPELLSRRSFLKGTSAVILSAFLGSEVTQASEDTDTIPQEEVSPDIYYGREATQEEAAFDVSVSVIGRGNGSGVILNRWLISTAYHGLFDKDGNRIDVSNMYVFSGGDLSQPAHRVQDIFRLGSGGTINQNDRVLLILETPFDFSDKIKPIPIGVPEMITHEELYVIGHGRNEESSYSRYPRVGKQIPYWEMDSGCRLEPGTIVTRNVDETNQAVTHKGDSGGGLFAAIPEGHPLYEPGYYLLGTTTKFCSSPEYDEEGQVIPDYRSGFQSIFFDNGAEQIQQKIAETNQWPDPPKMFLPQIESGKYTTSLPYTPNN